MSGNTTGSSGTSNPTKGRDSRMIQRQASVVADLVAVLAATLCAIALRDLVAPMLGLQASPFALEWHLAIPFITVLGAFYSGGLYERDAYVSRPLHAWTVMRATVLAFVVSAASAFLVGPSGFNVSRLTLVLTFALFPPIVMLLRLGVLHAVYVAWVKRFRPVSFVVGDSTVSRRIVKRLSRLRGFDDVRTVDPVLVREDGADAVAAELNHVSSDGRSADIVFVDSSSVPPRDVLDIIMAAQRRRADVYVISGLLGPLEGSRLLSDLFQTPVTRVRRPLVPSAGYALKRTLDVLGSATMLLLFSPVIAMLAVIIKSTSEGPVFHTQTRVGRSGRTFEFLKFRSMYANSDSSGHQQYVRRMIRGEAKPLATDANGNGVFHLVDDPRVTPIGGIIRKYSLDEIPQLWNVLRGDMSLVGPRPPLPYEASEYDEWQRQRLEVQCGITGVWQVVGRNRVSFDEMTFQDLMYAMNMGLWVDLCLCVRTIPAALLGGGL
jgi:exopolysaccharide biosynthesis polyprenyl glycosylphosphotransferase